MIPHAIHTHENHNALSNYMVSLNLFIQSILSKETDPAELVFSLQLLHNDGLILQQGHGLLSWGDFPYGTPGREVRGRGWRMIHEHRDITTHAAGKLHRKKRKKNHCFWWNATASIIQNTGVSGDSLYDQTAQIWGPFPQVLISWGSNAVDQQLPHRNSQHALCCVTFPRLNRLTVDSWSMECFSWLLGRELAANPERASGRPCCPMLSLSEEENFLGSFDRLVWKDILNGCVYMTSI